MSVIVAFYWLILFLFVGWLINKIMKKPVMNGAEWFFWIFLAQIVWAAIMLFRPTPGQIKDPEPGFVFGYILGAYLVPMLIAAGFAWNFRRKKKKFHQSQDSSSNNQPNTDSGADAPPPVS